LRDTVAKKKHPEASLEAIKAFKKLYDLNDPKFKDWEDAFKDNMYVLALVTFNEGVDQYQAKNYAQAFQYFYSLKDLNTVFEGKKKNSNIEISRALKFAGLAAEAAGDKAGALKAYKDWVEVSSTAAATDTAAKVRANNAAAFQKYGLELKVTGDTVGAKKVIDDGLAKYPKDAALLVEKINFYLEAGKYTDALTFVNNLLEVEPKNDGAWFIKGLAFDKMGKEDSVVYSYGKAIEINPKSTNSYINLAAVYVNKAKDINIEMNKLGNTSADIKKYDEMKGQVKELYLKAKPYLEKAKELEPDDKQVGRTLYQINGFLESNK